MKKIWNYLFFAGFLPFIVPVCMALYSMSVETWNFLDWILLYSVIYWPTYVIGILVIVIAAKKRKNGKDK